MVTFSDIGRAIGQMAVDQSTIRENISGDDPDGAVGAFNSESIIVTGEYIASSLTIATDSFVVDHPVKGDVDSSIYLIDGGYSSSTVLNTGKI